MNKKEAKEIMFNFAGRAFQVYTNAFGKDYHTAMQMLNDEYKIFEDILIDKGVIKE